MNWRRIVHLQATWGALVFILLLGSCNVTKNVPADKYLLRSNSIKLKATVPLTQKGELKSNLEKLVGQKTNSYTIGIPFKLIRYNAGYKKFQRDPDNYQLKMKAAEPPVIYDSSLKKKSALNIKAYLFNKGFFYAKVNDTTLFKKNKAYVHYTVETGINYLINKSWLDIDDTVTKRVLSEVMDETILAPGSDFSYDLCEQEKSRITNYLRDYGYYKFTTENVTFELDTFNKQYFNDAENPFESAINFIAFQKNKKKPTLDVRIIVRDNENGDAYRRYGLSNVRVIPDFMSSKDYRDTTTMRIRRLEKVLFKYHNYYVHENVILRHMITIPGRYYSQTEYDQTLSKLNELGVFSSVRITYREDTSIDPYNGYWLNSNILMSPADKFNYNTNWDLSNGTNYLAGTNLTLSLRNNNFGKGANLLTMSVTGGVETYYDSTPSPFFQHIKMLSRSVGGNISLDMPKFLFPLKQDKVSSLNAPRTVVNLGVSLLDRIGYFNLLNVSTGFQYKWRETRERNWEISPVFINNIDISHITPAFQLRLDSNQFLRNSYSSVLIEGENIARIYSDKEVKHGLNYNYLRLGVEEAGGLLSGLNALKTNLTGNYARYVKFDIDAQHFFTYPHATLAGRFVLGAGLPYGGATTLPYIKQYFVGGAYSLRGFRIRTLGPGSSLGAKSTGSNVIDRTGDIKLESTAEYRFDMLKLFSGAIKMNGAVFADAGNIWLASKTSSYPNGEFDFSRLDNDIAVDAGFGIRLDLSGFFIFRVDVAIPVKKPEYYTSEADAALNNDYYYGDKGWTISKISPTDNTWRRKEMVINFAIGYPF